MKIIRYDNTRTTAVDVPSGRACPRMALFVFMSRILCSGSPIKFGFSQKEDIFAACRGYP